MITPEFYASVPAKALEYFVGRRILTRPAKAPSNTQMQWVTLSDTNMIGARRRAWEDHITAWFRFPRDEPLELSNGTVAHDYMGFAHYLDTNWLMAELTAEEHAQARTVDLGQGYRITEWEPTIPTPAPRRAEAVPTEYGDQFALF